MEFITRDYNSIALLPWRGAIVKTSTEDRLADESRFYKEIPSNVSTYFPRIIDSYHEDGKYNLELEYFPFENLATLWHSHRLDGELWENVCKYLKTALFLFKSIDYIGYDEESLLREKMFVNKTENEYNSLINKFPFFKELHFYSTINLNGKSYQNFHNLWEGFLRQWVLDNYCTDEELTFMHGDLCFSNILCGFDRKNNVVLKFIDPRGSFGKPGCFGDIHYDLAKLMHSIDGKYECFIYDKFRLDSSNKNSFALSTRDMQPIDKYFNDYLFSHYDMTKIKIIQGLIFIGMCARHYDSHERQVAMYLTGLRILNECYKDIIDA